MDFLKQKIQDLEKSEDIKVIYISEVGSHLYGLNTEKSDIDYAGIFIPSEKSVLLKEDKLFYKSNTNNNSKNSSDDIDFMLHSIYKFMSEISVGETGAIDLLFSMFSSNDSVKFTSPESEMIKNNYKALVSTKVKKFVGYCVSQSSQYGLKGSRWKEINELSNSDIIKELKYLSEDARIGSVWDKLVEFCKDKKYIKMVEIDGLKYIQVLNKNFQNTITVIKFLRSVENLKKRYGERSKASVNGVDWKALSHSVRIITEAEELLTTGFIEFPVKNREFIMSVKNGTANLEEVTEWLSNKIDEVNNLVLTSRLPDSINEETRKKIILDLVKS